MTRLFKVIAICGLLLTLGACAVPVTFKNYTTGDVWGSDRKDITVKINGKKELFFILASIPSSKDSTSEDIVKSNELWVNVYVTRVSSERDPINVYYHDVPVLYSAQDAYVKDENGKITKADPEIYFAKIGRNGQKDGPIASFHQQTVDINSKDIWIYLRFNTPRLPGSQWKLHLGQATINNVSIELPDFTILFRKDKIFWKPVFAL